MAYLNKVTMIGNLTRNPEIKKTPTGTPICIFGIASNHSFKNKQSGTMEKDVCFIDVNIWGPRAEKYSPLLKTGQEILVEGHIKFNTWKDKSGNSQSKHLIVAERVIPMFPNPERVEKLNASQPISVNNSDGTPTSTQNCNSENDLPF